MSRGASHTVLYWFCSFHWFFCSHWFNYNNNIRIFLSFGWSFQSVFSGRNRDFFPLGILYVWHNKPWVDLSFWWSCFAQYRLYMLLRGRQRLQNQNHNANSGNTDKERAVLSFWDSTSSQRNLFTLTFEVLCAKQNKNHRLRRIYIPAPLFWLVLHGFIDR